MKRFDVHLYREMRLAFTDITADSPEAAAKHAAGLPKEDAHEIDDCEGEEDARARALAAIATKVDDTPNTSDKSNATGLPPDPEGMNDGRASSAGHALAAFQQVTGADDEDALCDLLADLMHWCDRNDNKFERALERAKWHYEAETQGELS